MLLLAALASGRGATCADDPPDPARLLRRVARADLPLAERLEAANLVLASKTPVQSDEAVRAGVSLLDVATVTGSMLVKRGLDDGWVDPETRAGASAKAAAVPESVRHADEGVGSTLAALGMLLGERQDGVCEAVTGRWPPNGFVLSVLRAEMGTFRGEDGKPLVEDATPDRVRERLSSLLPAARLLDRAAEDDPAVSLPAMDALRAMGKGALPLLVHEAEQAAAGIPEGRVGRATRAIVVLGMIRDRAATPALVKCLAAANGWVRSAAATALGDVGDPAAAAALARQLVYAGDPFRVRDQWDYPGTTETNIPFEQWQTVEYYNVDGAAADALLRMGFDGAAGWLIQNRLDPGKANFRIRVLQDAVDTLRRSAPDSPWADYNVDEGLPQRYEAFEALAAWWRGANAMKPDGAPLEPVEADLGFQAAAKEVVDHLIGAKVLEKMIAGDTCVLLSRALTPALAQALASAKNPVQRTELAKGLRLVRDRRAVEPLLGLSKDKKGFVRAASTEGLGPYVHDGDAPVLDAVLSALEDAEAGPAMAAMLALVHAPPSERVLAAVRAHSSAAFAARFGRDTNYERAETVVLLIQEGEAHWPAVKAGLASKDRVDRRTWWDLLRAALDLPPHLFNPDPAPGDATWREVDERVVLDALAKRRGR